MPVNKKAIEQLKADLRRYARRYDQSTFGATDPECGTVMCMAGFCLWRKIGGKKFSETVRKATFLSHAYREFIKEAKVAGREALGLTRAEPLIFQSTERWPIDLRTRYLAARLEGDHRAMVEVACDGLDRLNENGSIRALEVTT